MKSLASFFPVFALVVACAMAAFAQTAVSEGKQFKDGLSFKYPAEWAFNDTSNADA
ncbi:MAG: hypothetical protein ABR501_00655 [Pyrinomonadaceae bacterium]